MSKIDKLKEEISWLKIVFSILVSVQPQRHRVHRELGKLATNRHKLTCDIR